MNTQPKILFFDTKPYDQEFFDQANRDFGYEIKYFAGHLSSETVSFAKGYNVVCAFVNDVINQKVIEALKSNGIQLVAMRCAGYNNVDLKAAYKNLHVVRVPE